MRIVYYKEQSTRSRLLGEAMQQACQYLGIPFESMTESDFTGKAIGDVAFFYGLRGNMRRIIQEYTNVGKKAVLFDLGYWGRHNGGRWNGYHRIAINGYHAVPTEEIYQADRLAKLGVPLKEFNNTGSKVLLCGQSRKAAWVYNMQPEEWELQAIQRIRKYFSGEIVYMPKGSWKEARPLPETTYYEGDLENILPECLMVVSHHSNSSVHALVAGKPIITDDGIAKQFSNDYSDMLFPKFPTNEERQQFLNQVAYWQWTVPEIRSGVMLSNLISREVL